MLTSFVTHVANSKFSPFLSEYRESILIGWHINDVCNFHCAYCPMVQMQGKQKQLDESVLAGCFDRVGWPLIINISGGEPFLYRGIVELCIALTKNHLVSINTNLSTDNVYEFAEKVDPSRVAFVIASLHIQERERTKKGFNDYLDKLLCLQAKRFNVRASYVAYPPLLPRIHRDFYSLGKAGVSCLQVEAFQGTYRGQSYPKAYSHGEIDTLKSLGMDCDDLAVLENTHRFRGHLCFAGINSFSLNVDGRLHRCNQSHKSYGNLFNGDIRFDRRPKPCPFATCTCPAAGILSALEARSRTKEIFTEILRENFSRWKNGVLTCATNLSYAMKKAKRTLPGNSRL